MLCQHPLREVHPLRQVIELLPQPVELLFELVHTLLGASHEPVLRERRFRQPPVAQRQILAVAELTRSDQHEVVEVPDPAAAEREEHRDGRARLVDVKAMESENAAKERQRQRQAAGAPGDGVFGRLVGVVAVNVGERHARYYGARSDGASKWRSAGSSVSKRKWNPDACKQPGSTRCPLCNIAAPSVPNAMRSANVGTVRTAGRRRTLPNVRANSRFVTGFGAVRFTGPTSLGVASPCMIALSASSSMIQLTY